MGHNKFSVRDFIFGIFVGAFFIMVFSFFQVKDLASRTPAAASSNSSSSGGVIDSSSSTQEMKVYKTDVKDWTITANDGTVFNLKTPEGYYSLADQYAESMNTYYNVTLTDDEIVCVGDASQQYNSTVLLNAATLSSTKKVITDMYAEDDTVDISEFTYSEAYEYMTTGSLPETAENVELLELDKIVSTSGMEFRVFQVDRDTEYYTDDTMTETEMVHSQELVAYSQNDDALEILVYMQNYDKDTAVAIMTEFIN